MCLSWAGSSRYHTPPRQLDRSIADDDRLPTHANVDDRARSLVDLYVEEAGSTHLEALLDAPSECAIRSRIASGQITAESDARAARGGILGYTQPRREHARANLGPGELGIVGEDEDNVRPLSSHDFLPRFESNSRPTHCSAISQRNEQNGQAARESLRPPWFITQVMGLERQNIGEARARRRRWPELGKLGDRQLFEHWDSIDGFDEDAYGSDPFLDHDASRFPGEGNLAQCREDVDGTQRRV